MLAALSYVKGKLREHSENSGFSLVRVVCFIPMNEMENFIVVHWNVHYGYNKIVQSENASVCFR